MAPKDLKTHKQHPSNERTGSPPPMKKVKNADTVHRSHRAGKGNGGAAEQLEHQENVEFMIYLDKHDQKMYI